jgi:hypothetical protein
VLRTRGQRAPDPPKVSLGGPDDVSRGTRGLRDFFPGGAGKTAAASPRGGPTKRRRPPSQKAPRSAGGSHAQLPEGASKLEVY